MATFQVFFDSPGGIYQPGEMVTGRVILQLRHSTTLRGIELIFNGQSAVEWVVDKLEQDNRRPETRHRTVQVRYQSEELYFATRFFIYGDAYNNTILHVGEYTFNFTTQLPQNLPTSFEGEHGYVRYAMSLASYPNIMSVPIQTIFRVVNPLDLNLVPNVKSPVMVMDEKTLCCWCCASSPISCVLRLPVSGFAMGHHMPIIVEVDNLSDKNVNGVKVTLERKDTFTAIRPQRQTREAIYNIGVLWLGTVSAKSSQTWEKNMEIPSGPPSELRHCSIISSTYVVKVNVELPSPHIDLCIKAPVIIGNIPLRAIDHYVVPAASAQEAPPPSYSEAVTPSAPPPVQ